MKHIKISVICCIILVLLAIPAFNASATNWDKQFKNFYKKINSEDQETQIEVMTSLPFA